MFRKLNKSKIAFVLAILFGISLFFFKSGSSYSNLFNSDSVVAKVSNTSISTTKFNRTMQMNIDKFNQMIGKSMNGDEIRAFQIHSLALSALITEAVFEDEYDKINFKLDEEVIAKNTKERIPQLYDKNNKLNEIYLNTFLQQQQLKLEDIVQIIDYETRDKYFDDAFFNINYSRYFSDNINKFNTQERKISYLEIPLDQIYLDENLNKDGEKFNKELDSYFNENTNNYMKDEKRNVDFIIIDKKLLSINFIPSDNEIKEYFKLNKDLFFEEEKRSFIQYNFKTLEEAKAFKEKINNQNFEDIKDIIEYSKKDNLQYNEFKNLKSNEILDEIADPLFKLDLNQQSDIIETSLAKHILILQSISSAYQKNLAEVKDEIKNTIVKIETDNYQNELSDSINEMVLNGLSIEEISKKFNLEIDTLKNVTRNYNKYEKSKEAIFKSLIPQAFITNKDFVSDVNIINDNISYIFNVTKIQTSIPENLLDIRDVVINDYINSKKIKQMKLDSEKNRSNKLYVSNLAKKYNKEITQITLSKNSNDIPYNLITNIFDSNISDNISNVYNNILYTVKINDIMISEKNESNEIISINNDLRGSFGQELTSLKKITTNDNLVNAILEQY